MTIRNLLRTASDKLEATFEENVSEWIVYRPVGEQRTGQILATPGGRKADSDEDNSVHTDIENQDFIIRVLTEVKCQDDTFLHWLGREPEQNDEISFGNQLYLVTPLPNGEAYRYTDAFRSSLRIHTTAAGAVT